MFGNTSDRKFAGAKRRVASLLSVGEVTDRIDRHVIQDVWKDSGSKSEIRTLQTPRSQIQMLLQSFPVSKNKSVYQRPCHAQAK